MSPSFYKVENLTLGRSVQVETTSTTARTIEIRLGDRIRASVVNFPPNTEVHFQIGGYPPFQWNDVFIGITDAFGNLATPISVVEEFLAVTLSSRAIVLPNGPWGYINLLAVNLLIQPMKAGLIMAGVGLGAIIGFGVISRR